VIIIEMAWENNREDSSELLEQFALSKLNLYAKNIYIFTRIRNRNEIISYDLRFSTLH